jgi:putative NADPH-quinone reductase
MNRKEKSRMKGINFILFTFPFYFFSLPLSLSVKVFSFPLCLSGK